MKVSRITDLSREELITRLASEPSLSAFLRSLGYVNPTGGCREQLIKRCEVEDLMDCFISLTQRGKSLSYSQLKSVCFNRTPSDSVLIENSRASRQVVKRCYLQRTQAPYQCVHCGLTDTWNSKPIVLQLDHINGISDDHRLENLRLLCPNCHSQTDTFTGKKRL